MITFLKKVKTTKWIPAEMVSQVSQEEILGHSTQAYIWTATKQSKSQRRRAGIVEENRTAPAPCGKLPQGAKFIREVNVEVETQTCADEWT